MSTLPNDIDEHILSLVIKVNKRNDFKTTLSCGGHFAKSKRHAYTLEEYEEREEWAGNASSICSKSSQPYLTFVTNSMPDLLNHLKMCSFATLYPHPQQSDKYTFGYDDCDEGYNHDNNTNRFSIKPRFREFWQWFADGWYKETGVKLVVPNHFPIDSERVCDSECCEPQDYSVDYDDDKHKHVSPGDLAYDGYFDGVPPCPLGCKEECCQPYNEADHESTTWC